MSFIQLQKKELLVINTKIITKTNNEKYSLKICSLPINNIRSITRLYTKDNKKFGKYKAYTKIVMTNNKLFGKKTVYSPETFETIIKNSIKKSKKSPIKNYNNNKSSLIFISTKIIRPKNKYQCEETDGKYCLNEQTLNTQIIRSIMRQDKKYGKYIAYTKIVRNTKTMDSFGRLRKTFYSSDTLENLIKNTTINNSENNNYYNMW
jgi:hypothetical protein